MQTPKAESRTENAYKQIRGELLACRLAPGQKVNFSELVQKLGFSLGAVREALSRLTSEGFLEAETNKAYYCYQVVNNQKRETW